MKIIVLSSKIKVSLISKKYAFGVAFGALGAHFGHHFGRLCALWDSFWRPLGSQSGPKVEKKAKKEWKNEVLNRPGRPDGPKGHQRSPCTCKMDTKISKQSSKIKKNSHVSELTLRKILGWIDCLRALTLQKKSRLYL